MPNQCVCGTPSAQQCSVCRSQFYCSKECQKNDWPRHKTEQCQQKLQDRLETIHSSLIQSGDPLINSIIKNAATSRYLTFKSTQLDQSLISALADSSETFFFRICEVISSRILTNSGITRRIIATTGVFTCITIFAWSPPNENERLGKYVAAHIYIGALLDGILRSANSPLDELVRELKATFRGVPANSVKVKIVGGLKFTDKDKALPMYFSSDTTKHYFSWHVINAVIAAGFPQEVIDTSLLNVWAGNSKSVFEEPQMSLKNKRFSVVALDALSGEVFTHTYGTVEIEHLIPESEVVRQQFFYHNMPEFGRTRLQIAEIP